MECIGSPALPLRTKLLWKSTDLLLIANSTNLAFEHTLAYKRTIQNYRSTSKGIATKKKNKNPYNQTDIKATKTWGAGFSKTLMSP